MVAKATPDSSSCARLGDVSDRDSTIRKEPSPLLKVSSYMALRETAMVRAMFSSEASCTAEFFSRVELMLRRTIGTDAESRTVATLATISSSKTEKPR